MRTSESTGQPAPNCECGAQEGQLHHAGCRWELCPFCACTDAEGCECAYDHLGLKRREHPAENRYLSTQVYENGLSEEQWARWLEIRAKRGRLPYVYAPQMCARCGALWPDIFMVQDAAWEYYAGPQLRSALVCEHCFTVLRESIDQHQTRPAWVPSGEEIREYLDAFRRKDQETLRRMDPGKFERGTRNLKFP